MIQIITIEREYGSGAAGIAAKSGWSIGLEAMAQLLTEEIPRLAHCESSVVQNREERRDSLYHRLLKSFALGATRRSRGAPIERSMLTAL
jgi:hypothetical protein